MISPLHTSLAAWAIRYVARLAGREVLASGIDVAFDHHADDPLLALASFGIGIVVGIGMGRSRLLDGLLQPWVSMMFVTSIACVASRLMLPLNVRS